jgi:hypothetical protein
MRIVLRIAIILAAALVVAGATLALSQTGLLSSVRGAGREGFERGGATGEARQGDATERPIPQDGERRFERGQLPAGRGGRGQGGLNAFAVAPLVKNLGIMLGITAVFAVANSAYRGVKRRHMALSTSTST